MIYQHQQNAIDYITNKFLSNYQVDALLISGSIAHGFNDEHSDVDMFIMVSEEVYQQKEREQNLTYWESAGDFYEGGYFDGKYITLQYLSLVAQNGNEPTKFAFHDAQIAFDKTGKVADLLKQICVYDMEHVHEKAIRFVAQLDAWNWYCEEALKKNNQYLLELSVSKLILFAGRLILLDNKILFPYHKWFMSVLEEDTTNKPLGFITAIQSLIKDKTQDHITHLYELVKNYKDWTNGTEYSWPSYFVHDIETVWTRQSEFVENI